MTQPKDLLDRNRAWSERRREADPAFFERLAAGQAPRFLWIGCSDSRVPAAMVAGLEPGDLFVHRNIANVVPPADLNALSVLAYAVGVLRVEHVIVCGHTGCGGVAAALDGRPHGLVDPWLRTIKDVAARHAEELAALEDGAARVDRLAELNAIEQARNVARTSVVQAAWARGQALTVQAWIYGLADGRLRDLGFAVRGPDEVAPAYRLALEPDGQG